MSFETNRISPGNQIAHPGIVRVVSSTTDSSPGGIATEFQRKVSTSAQTVDHLFGTFRNEIEALDLLHELAITLSDFHAEGILHGNLHPRNVFLAPRGDEDRIRIADFGQAYIGAAHHVPLSADTLRILAPEQLRRPDDFDTQEAFRWDVYSFGVLAYRILTAEWPRGQRYIETYGAQKPHETNRFLEFLQEESKVRWFGDPDSEACQKIRDVIEDCLSLQPEKRPRTGADIRIRLTQISHEIETETNNRSFAAVRKSLLRKLFLTRFAALALISIATFATLFGVTNRERALTAENLVEDRNASLTTLGTSLAAANSAYGQSLGQLGKSRAAADQFYTRLSSRPPLLVDPPPYQPGAGGDWLRSARSYYSETIDNRDISLNPDLDSARAHHGLAHTAFSLGDNASAAKHFREAISIFEKLADRQSEGDLHTEYFRRIAHCFQKLWTLEPSAWSDASLALLEKSAHAFQSALQTQPENEHLLIDAAAAYYYLGVHQSKCRLRQPALDSLSRALELLSLLENIRDLRDEEHFLAARAYTSAGALLRELDLDPSALDAQVMSLEILIELTANTPRNTSFQVELARCYCELGELFQSPGVEGVPPGSDPHPMLNEANRILASVLADETEHPTATLILARTYMGQAKLLRGDNNSEALELGRKAVNLLTDLVDRNPDDGHLPFQLAFHKVEYMRLLAEVAKFQDAIRLGEEASAAIEGLILDHENLVAETVIKNYQLTLADLYEQLGSLTEKQSDPKMAASHFAKAIDHWELLAANHGTGGEIGTRLQASRHLLEQIREPGPTAISNP